MEETGTVILTRVRDIENAFQEFWEAAKRTLLYSVVFSPFQSFRLISPGTGKMAAPLQNRSFRDYLDFIQKNI